MIWRVATAATLLLALAGAASAQEVIRSYDARVDVARDGTLTVVENVRVRAEGREIRRGIYRDFPLTFRDAEGRLRRVSFRLLGVQRDGRHEPHHTRGNPGGVRIYAGSEDVPLPRGEHTYTFRYQTGRQLRWFDGKAELYWNVTGNEWNFPIERAGVHVVFEGDAPPERWTAYTGRYGERGSDWRGEIDGNGDLLVQTTRQLARGEGLSIAVTLPTGAVNPPSRMQQLYWSFLDWRGWFIGALGLALLLAYYSFAWRAVGRDPAGGTIIPLFHPPEGVSPALANYIHEWGYGRNLWRAFTAASLSLAVRGLLTFDEKDGDLTLKSTGKEPVETLPAGERAIHEWVRGEGGSASIDRDNGTSVAKIGEDFKQRIEAENKHKFFRKNLGYFLAGLALTAGVMASVLVFGGISPEEYAIVVGAAFVGIFVGVFSVPMVGTISRLLQQPWNIGTALKLIFVGGFGGYFLLQFASVLGSIFGGIGDVLPTLVRDYPFPFALIGTFAAINGLFLYLLRAPTDIGRQIMDKLEGFSLYLQTAESARLNMSAPEITAERFEALLPYAVALDVEKPWAEAFEAALRRAHPGAADPTSLYRPRWTSSSAWSGNTIGNAVSSSVAAATGAFTSAVPVSSSGSSGFSGGGGSGGGGGGGGGGGW
jgi:uncharacterized membrane protein YgcG